MGRKDRWGIDTGYLLSVMSRYLIASLSLIDKGLTDLRPAPSRALQHRAYTDEGLERGKHCGVHTNALQKS